MLVLFFNKDDTVKKAALDAYQRLYLWKDLPKDEKAKSLINLLWEADSTEETKKEKILSVAVWEKIVDSDIYM